MAEADRSSGGADAWITGGEMVIEIFGCWPKFHEAEVLWLRLDRHGAGGTGPTLEAEVHAFEMTAEVAPGGHYVLKNHVRVHLRFHSVEQVCLDGFNHQNVLFGLTIRAADGGSGESPHERRVAVTLDPSFGLGGSFLCERVEVVTVRPCDGEGNPADVSCPM